VQGYSPCVGEGKKHFVVSKQDATGDAVFVGAQRTRVTAAMSPAGFKASEPMLMWEALRQATDEARASLRRSR
jgi:hypothetical protein